MAPRNRASTNWLLIRTPERVFCRGTWVTQVSRDMGDGSGGFLPATSTPVTGTGKSPVSGDPVRVGEMTGIALTDEGDGGNGATETTVLLVAHDGEWTRRRIESPEIARRWAHQLSTPIYDVKLMGYPQRMRDYNERQKRRPVSD